ncbi:uncharacterized protein VTP21DRAFT_4041 [Calcarisporiella thermophila]|uniref:uncharacterized protein n=1 Tax=Calcarisporiella thermophila TaxID=911321 RepID=UPI0037446402
MAFPSHHHPSRPVDREKAETELALNVKKATSPDETAPKQKHVRSCIVYTWDYHTSQSIWTLLKMQPILSDEVQTFKALITVHKLLCDGHPNILREAQAELPWVQSCSRSVMGDGSRGYGTLIRAYVEFLLAKLNYHRVHPDFTGNFDYKEYVSLKGIDDPNEGYETISDLMNLQDQIDAFQKLIFSQFRPSTNNECRIAALVPLVEESYGIYKFVTNMLRAMHRRTDAIDALEPLRTRFNAQHYRLLKFYYECSNLKYLTSLTSVPKLPQDPPSLMDTSGPPSLPKRQATVRDPTPTPPPPQPDPEPIIDFWSETQAQQQREYEMQQQLLAQQHQAELERQRQLQLQQQREFEELQRIQAERERQQREQLMREQMQRQTEGRVLELERELLGLRGQFERDQLSLQQYDQRVKALENELSQLNLNAQQRDASKDELIKSLQDQIAMWKNKYEALAKLYSQLRQEHLELLNKTKQLQLKANSAQEAIERMERLQGDMKAKNMELADMIRERDRARNELERLKSSHLDELNRLRRELSDANTRVEELGRTKGAEVERLLSKFNREKSELESVARDKQHTIDDLLRQLEERRAEVERIQQEKDEEIAIMQAGMDQSLLALADLQRNSGDKESTLQTQLDSLTRQHIAKLAQILDSILASCIQKVADGVYDLEVGGPGNQNATPEFALSLIEMATASSNEFSTAFSIYLQGGKKGGDPTDVISAATNLAQAIVDVMANLKGVTRLAQNDEKVEELITSGKSAGERAISFFSSVTSKKIDALSAVQRPEVVLKRNMELQQALQHASQLTEKLVGRQAGVSSMADSELGDLVEREMLSAARAVEEATAKIQALMQAPRPEVSSTELQVHSAILDSVMAITNAIAHLIRCATDAQQEIVAQGRGTSSAQAFYKKNNRWTEGLISAAKAVAVATNILVQAADGVIHDTHSLEQLIVASNEVAAATAQLVAASRVKATFMSRTQERLEAAARAVTDAASALVKAVKTIAQQRAESKSRTDYARMAAHEFKVKEMEQQVLILRLEQELTNARRELAEMRKVSYHQDED